MIIIGRPINGIPINGLEYVLDDDGDVMKFENEETAKEFLRAAGVEDMDGLDFIEEED